MSIAMNPGTAPTARAQDHSSMTDSSVTPIKVLIAEDDENARSLITDLLTTLGHTIVAEVSTGRDAFERAKDVAPDVVLLDFRLPDSDDLSLVEGIRKKAPSSAIVMMTAYGTQQMTEQAKRLGVSEIIGKPFDMGALEDVIVKAYQSKPH